MSGMSATEGSISQDGLLALLGGALATRSRQAWSQWLQGEIQGVLPHHALIAAWGDFRANDFNYDVTSASAALCNEAQPRDVIEPLMQTLFAMWVAGGMQPTALDSRPLRSVGSALFAGSPCVLVHGVQDRRSRYDCLYVFIGPAALDSAFSRQLCRMALPYLDTAFRQLADRSDDDADDDASDGGFSISTYSYRHQSDLPATRSGTGAATGFADSGWGDGVERGAALSARELEIMEWVRMGKTNSEIALILNLSIFTVKNHMRRIYRKLDVLNRAQAVGSLDRMLGPLHDAVR